MKVRCPHCKTIKTIDKTDKNIQVRCGKRGGGCGERFYVKENIVLEKEENKTMIKTNKTIKPRFLNHNGSLESLIICVTYGINTIKNKKQVKERDLNSTWYQHFQSWSKWRETLQMALEEKR